MKKYIFTLCLAIFSVCLSTGYAQNIDTPDEFIGGIEPILDFPDEDKSENTNIRIGFDFGSFIFNHALINSVNRRNYGNWLNKQKDILKKAIENKLGKNYNHLNDGLKDVFKNIETPGLTKNVRGVHSNYGGKVGEKTEIRDKDIRNIKLLDLRKAEIKAGKTNSEYGHLKYGATPIKNLRTISQVDGLRNTTLNHLKENDVLWVSENNTLLMLAEIQNALSRKTIGNHPFMNHVANQQLNYVYSSNDDLVDLDVIQLYVNSVNAPINYVATLFNQKVFLKFFTTPNLIEHFAINNHGRPRSIFHKDAHIDFLHKYGPIERGRELHRQRNERIAQWLNSMSREEMLTETMIENLGSRNKNFLDARPKLRQEVSEYFKTNNFSEVSHDCINYLLNQLQSGQNFAPDVNLYETRGKILKQSAFNPNTAIRLNLNPAAIKEGFKGFSNVLSVLLENNKYPEYEGFIIRNIFGVNGLNFDATISNDWFGNGFYFSHSDENSIQINFEDNNNKYGDDIDIFKPCRSSFNFKQLGTTGSYEATINKINVDVDALWTSGPGRPVYSFGEMIIHKIYVFFPKFSGSMVTNSVEVFNKAENDLDRFFSLYLQTNQHEPTNIEMENAFLGFLNTRLAAFKGLAKRLPSNGNNLAGKLYKHCLFGF